MDYSPSSAGFRFGLETEYIVFDRNTGRALWHEELNFNRLNELLEKISLEGIRSLEGLELEKPHTKQMPYVVEGYHLPDQDFNAVDLLPKGIEIRTPVCDSIGECLSTQAELLKRLELQLREGGLSLLALSHHPNAHHFRGPQNKRRHDFWRWAMEVMTTYGPDINVGVPKELWEKIDHADLEAKINFYSPALSALSLRAPFRDGGLWKVKGQVGKSLRVYRRSIVAPPIEFHPHEGYRYEFKIFDMTPSFALLESYFHLFLTLLLSSELEGRASDATRIYDSGRVALLGFEEEMVVPRISEVLAVAEKNLPAWGFSASGLRGITEVFDSRKTPAEALVEDFLECGEDLSKLLAKMATQTTDFSRAV